jgi:outer membrane immunogenic protein
MKKTLLAAAFVAASSLSANAADLAAKPYYKAAVAPVAYTVWNKCYIGISGGYITSANSRTSITPNDPNLALSQALGNVPTSLSSDPDGGIIGGTVGCNYQTGNVVFGGETDLSYTSLRSTDAVTIGGFNVTTTYRQEMQAFGTVRGRLGYAVGPTLFYATGGLAYGDLKESATIIPGPAGIALGGAQLAGNRDQWRAGWTVGGGVEHMISDSWSVKAEYLYYDLGRSSVVATTFAGAPNESGTFSHRNQGHIIRAGINYQFGGPVVAKY